jgi:hypothetical protein
VTAQVSDTAAADDEVRRRVEATLRRITDDLLAIPCATIRATRHVADGLARTAAQPFVLARSVGQAIGAGSLGLAARSPSIERSAMPPQRRTSVERVSPTVAPADTDAAPAAVLPIEDYESLPASYVVARLQHLEPAELETVRAFEEAHRGRRTVLGRIEQLLAER